MTEETEVQYPSVEEHLAQMRVRKIKNLIAVTFVATLVVGFGYMTARSDTPESAVQGFNVAQEQQLRSVMRWNWKTPSSQKTPATPTTFLPSRSWSSRAASTASSSKS